MNKSKKYVLSIDCGTQSIRGLIFDKMGNLLAKESIIYEIPYESPQINWAERDPRNYLDELCKVTNRLKDNFADLFYELSAVSITTQRDTCVLVDENYDVLRPAILWLDNRKSKKSRSLNPIYSLGTKIIGMKKTVDVFSKETPAHWIMENEPDVWSKTNKYLMLSTYLIYELTGIAADSISAQTGHMPLNYKKQIWDNRWGLKGNIFQIPPKKLYPIYPAGTVVGGISKEAADKTGLREDMPLILAGSDKACETLGTGCQNEEIASVSLGSQATIETASSRYYEVQRFIPPFPSAIPGMYNPEINVYRGFWLVSWFKEQFGEEELRESMLSGKSPEEILNEKIRGIEPGSQGLILQPYWGNELKRPESRGAIIGFNEEHTKYHIYRAIIEGIGYALKEGMLKIEKKSGTEISKVAISGGGAQSDLICQIMSDIFDRRTYKVQTSETSGLGAAICAFVGLNEYRDFSHAIAEMVHISSEFYPDEGRKQIYQELYHKGYSKIYQRLKPVYVELERMQNEDIDNN
ncbi:FGGY-family carbohydrate kinase [Alkalibacter mobilis]|uniref:FGGY-family carbohydrate kinase n=1 Tax=Alkalibacter mobilis TaxID=2787712 RepID=UPI00189CEFB8|nr:FGGY-family carbohydrate kinase [Alkalibacter mobilis]MBF7097098.1 FGGY-family carbohydrate kinase [Alkalibacter mobilis]